MAKFVEIDDRLQAFIERQRIFFVGTAAREGKVNVSPKGMDSLRIFGRNRIVWLNLTGSENETAAHLFDTPRMTLMWCSFEPQPMIVRAYGDASVVHRRDADWEHLATLFPSIPGARQLLDLNVSMVLTSCGFGVPLFEFLGERESLRQWAEKKGDDGVRVFWKERNQISLDGKPTRIVSE
jgi:hypothetical protein